MHILLCVFSVPASEVLPAAGLERADSQTRQLWRPKQSINMSVAQIWPPGSHRTALIPPIRLLPLRKKKENKHVRQGDNERSPALKDPRM